MSRKRSKSARRGSNPAASPAPQKPAASPVAPKPLVVAPEAALAPADERADRWQHLVSGAFHLDSVSPDRANAEARRYLDSVLQVFPGSVDPLEDFEGYAVRRMALALARALDAK